MVKKREFKITPPLQENSSTDNELSEQQTCVSANVPNPNATTDWFKVSVPFKNQCFKVSRGAYLNGRFRSINCHFFNVPRFHLTFHYL